MRAFKAIALLFVAVIAIALFYSASVTAGSVSCKGKPVKTIAMPVSGSNFSSYCRPCITALRTFARKPVIDTLVAAYERLQKSHPKVHFLYGEMGFPNGGRFRPHRTHRHGISVDLMVPLKDGKVMNTHLLNRYGYDVEFNKHGNGKQGEIDFEALATLMVAIETEAKRRGGKILRTYFAPDLQSELKAASPASLKGFNLNIRQAWVRHDDHIHIDFDFPCK